MAKNSPAKIRANNRYTSKAYDRLNIVIPKGQKSAVDAFAKDRGESVNALVNGLLRGAMSLTETEWKEGAKDDAE